MPVIGLTGDVGAGKSTISRVWREMGALVLDADAIAKSLWQDADVQRAAEARWGAGFFEGDIKSVHAKIAQKIFNDDAEYKFASELLHRATFEEIKRRVKNEPGWVVVEIPLLYESGHYGWLDYVVYVTAPAEKRVERNCARGWDENELTRREQWFLPREEKTNRADFILENNGTLEEWEAKGRELGVFFQKATGN